MTGLWLFCSFMLVGLIYYVSYGRFSYDFNNSMITNMVMRGNIQKGNATFAAEAKPTDIFDFCPYQTPDPWDESILKYVDVKHGYWKDCTPDEKLLPVTELWNGTVILKKGKKNFECRARCINYKNDHDVNLSHWQRINVSFFNCDFVETECKVDKETKRRFIHTQVAEQKGAANASLNPHKYPDVLLMVIDSVASTQIIRALPRTINFLMHGMEAVEFRKFNKVGLNSRPNAFPTLIGKSFRVTITAMDNDRALNAGKTTEAIVRKPMNLPDIPPDWTYDQFCHRYLDNESYIPLEFMKVGYKTFGAEDYVASILNYPNCYGTRRKQFHHTYRPFHIRLKKDKRLKHIHLQGLCRQTHTNILEYLSKFVNAYKGSPKFTFTWLVELTHDNTQWLYSSDYEIYDFFMENRDALNNSFIFFFGDHGPRFGKASSLIYDRTDDNAVLYVPSSCIEIVDLNSIRRKEAHTSIGATERNNPFLYIVLPTRLRHSNIHRQLLINSKELVTHHDLYITFKDILYNQPTANFTDVTFRRFDINSRGSSLLRKFEKGIHRNCKTLPIPFQYCICQYKKESVNDTKILRTLGQFAVERLEAVLAFNNVSSQCENINLGKALIREQQDGYQLGGDQFDRLDMYGKNGDCMEKDFLRPLCTCKKS